MMLKKGHLLYIFFIILSTLTISCAQQKEKKKSELEYKRKWFLPTTLDEISGLTWYADNTLACVNDEQGKIYLYHLEQEKIIKDYKFGKSGDYEGIAYQKPFFYVVKSNGKLYIYNEETNETDKVQLPFTIDNDIEGLCIYKNHLLVALKGKGGLEGKKSETSNIYSVNMEDLFDVDLAYQLPKLPKIGLSGIWANETTEQLIVLSHRSKHIFYIDAIEGTILKTIEFSRSMFEQPEGVCMSPDGRIFISNEQGDNLHANILEF
ncbi:SdiA-regulated domain-containing protein [Flammeovirga agarivorans]|uniref:Uncharacterized protein n=1 Tax=Flammeovirga agarivorans TaxID=2726742 RepID=A0A7X8SK28_9BACT|nr:SdiA-regulated domain-containing protein [Flammeovirga agarivorans]NLR91615.1 hypothetical protein [Flammeovirga agarivorans]